jgi:hypothetical protein
MPMVFALVFVAPLQLAIFGVDFFGTNPPPDFIKPIEYYILLVLKGAAAAWTVYLMIEATMTANAFERKKIILVSLGIVSLLFAIAVALGTLKVV